MKTKNFLKITGLLSIFIFAINLSSNAQVYSKSQSSSQIKPNTIFWIADTDTISLEKGKNEGNSIPDSLTVVVVLDTALLNKYNKADYQFEFKWYRWGPTQKYLKNVTIDTLKYADLKRKKVNSFTISSTKKGITSGWWEVNIISKSDNGYLNLNKKFEFQIYFDK